jgi:hypothetical protein
MASEPGAVTPKGETKRRLRRGARRAHLDIAPALPNEPSGADTADAGTADADAHATDAPKVRAKTKTKARSGAGIGAFVRGHVRLLLAAVFLVAGILLVILGWYGAAHTNILTEQIPYFISGGLLGMALIIVAGVVGSSAALERENRELRADLMRAMQSAPMRTVTGGAATASRRSDDGQVYIVPGGRSFHLSGCPIIEGKDGSELTMEEAVTAGFTSCKLCGID